MKTSCIMVTIWKNGVPETTLQAKINNLRNLVNKGANLYDPENVKETIARQKWSDGYKRSVVYAYETFLKFLGGTWERPKRT